MRLSFFNAAFLCLLAMTAQVQAQDQTQCVEPVPPAPVDGSQVSGEQLRAAMTATREFMALSDLYQICLNREVEASRALAVTESRAFDTAFADRAQGRVEASQQAKEKAGNAINTAITVYKHAHPDFR